MTPEEIDAASRAVQKTPNRITLEFIESQIASKIFARASDVDHSVDYQREPFPALPLLENERLWSHLRAVTVCVMVLRNGFVVIGHSAPLDPANFNAEHGQKLAYDQCIKQLWPFFAFARLEKASIGDHQ